PGRGAVPARDTGQSDEYCGSDQHLYSMSVGSAQSVPTVFRSMRKSGGFLNPCARYTFARSSARQRIAFVEFTELAPYQDSHATSHRHAPLNSQLLSREFDSSCPG